MYRPDVTEIQRPLRAPDHDPFVDDIAVKVVYPLPRSCGFVNLIDGRKRSIGPAS